MTNHRNNIDDHAEEHSFSSDYLLLRASEASLLDLIRLIRGHGSVKGRKFLERRYRVDGSELRDELNSRLLVLVSVVGQMVLLWLKKPMTLVGYLVETWLNLVICNGGFIKLLINFVTGKAVRPDAEGAAFRTMIGNLDTRLNLDPIISCNNHICYDCHVQHDNNHDAGGKHCNITAFICIMAAKLSYENSATIHVVVEDRWKMKLLGSFTFWNDFTGKLCAKAMMMQKSTMDKDLIVVSFKGTAPFDADDWATDINMSWYELQGVGKIHAGFMRALGLQRRKGWPKEVDMGTDQPKFAYYTIREKLRTIMQENKNARFVLTGHSLGGALAILFVTVLILHEEDKLLERLEGVYTFGQPRVGDRLFGEFMEAKLWDHDVGHFRYVYCNDMVPRMPFDRKSVLYKHFGTCLYYNSFYQPKVMQEEPNKNYFSIKWFIPVHVNAAWELIRSFTLHWTKGPDFKEGGCLRFFRLVGFFFPGLSAHGPQDYDNLARLSIDASFP
ncbi:hypothetical protein Droror1_Dr00010161 [Drosera rotundifolia]